MRVALYGSHTLRVRGRNADAFLRKSGTADHPSLWRRRVRFVFDERGIAMGFIQFVKEEIQVIQGERPGYQIILGSVFISHIPCDVKLSKSP